MPIHTDPNFTSPLNVYILYLWRGAAFEYIFSADNPISMSYMPPYHLIYTNGPLTNITMGSNVLIVYVREHRPLYIVKHYVYKSWTNEWDDLYFVFKLVNVTPSGLTDLNMWLPQVFARADVLDDNEYAAVHAATSGQPAYRVLSVTANDTHVIIRFTALKYVGVERDVAARLSSFQSGRTIRVTNSPIRGTYIINGTTYTIIALPYQYFAITPIGTTNLVIYVN
jgi:hypothetical protein